MSYRSQAVATTFLGTPLAFGLCALYAGFGLGTPGTNFMVAAFLFLPVWAGIMVWGLKRENPRVAWAGLGLTLLLITAILLVARRMAEG